MSHEACSSVQWLKYILCFLLSFSLFYLLAIYWPVLFAILVIMLVAGPFFGGVPLAGPFKKMKPYIFPYLPAIYLSIGLLILAVIFGFGPTID